MDKLSTYETTKSGVFEKAQSQVLNMSKEQSSATCAFNRNSDMAAVLQHKYCLKKDSS